MFRSRLIHRLSVRVLFIVLPAALLQAQFEFGTVLGVVHDSSGGIVPNTSVTLENVKTGVHFETKTDANGNYQFVNQRLGTYRVRVEAVGFETATAEDFELTVNARQRVDLTLQVGATSQNVTVSDAASLLETDNSSRGQLINPKQIVDLPLNGRAYADLTLLVAGGWSINLINTATSGLPLNITYSATSQYQVSTLLTPRPNLVSGVPVVTPEGRRTINNYLNSAAFAIPSYTQPFGNAGRNIARGYPFYQLDFGLHKNVPLWSESNYVQFRAEAFNLLNQTNFSPPGTTLGSSSFGVISSTFPARQLQLALKLYF